MFTSVGSGLETDRLNAIKDLVRGFEVASTDAAMIDQIRGLEEVAAAAAAKMMVVTAAFAASQRAAQAAAGVPKARVGRGSPRRSGWLGGCRPTRPTATSARPLS
jgi:hypothetical protein